MKCIGSPVAEIWPFTYVGGIWNPHLGRDGRRGSAMAPFERAMVVSYRLFIVTVGCAICSHSASNLRSNVSDAHINRTWVTLGQNFGCSPWSRPLLFRSAESANPRLTKGEIILEEFQPM